MTWIRKKYCGKKYTYNGVTKSIAEWADITGISQMTLKHRIDRGTPPEHIFKKKIPRKKPMTYKKRLQGNPLRLPYTWSPQAKACYEIGCNCSKCPIKTQLETKCGMKYTVRELVKLYGKPKEIED